MVWVSDTTSSSSEDESVHCLLNENHPYYGALTGDIAIDVKKPRGWGTRHTLAVLGCLGFFVSFSLRANMSVAIVAMVNHTALEQQLVVLNLSGEYHICPNHRSTNISRLFSEDGPFVWSELTQGLILSAYFMGYTLSQIPGGRVAERIGGSRTFGCGILLNSMLTMLTPICAFHSLTALVCIRVLQGLASGVTCPAMHFMLARWVPPPERSRITTFVYIGKQLGTAITILASGPLAGWGWAGGWQSIFYVTGATGVFWYICWFVLIYDTPSANPRIKAKERLYIDTHFKPHGLTGTPIGFPWRKAILSPAVLVLICTHFCQNWGDYQLVTELPTYFSTVLHYPLNENAIFSALPQLVKVLIALTVSFLSDNLVNKGVGLTTSRKIWNSIGMMVPALLLIGVSYTGCSDIAVIVLMTGIVGFNGAVFSGYNLNHMDLAPNFAGTLMGLTNCVATLAGVLAPFVTGYIINLHPNLSNWRIVFVTSASFMILGNTMFCLFGTSQQQDWNEPYGLYDSNIEREYKKHSEHCAKAYYRIFQMRREKSRSSICSI